MDNLGEPLLVPAMSRLVPAWSPQQKFAARAGSVLIGQLAYLARLEENAVAGCIAKFCQVRCCI